MRFIFTTTDTGNLDINIPICGEPVAPNCIARLLFYTQREYSSRSRMGNGSLVEMESSRFVLKSSYLCILDQESVL